MENRSLTRRAIGWAAANWLLDAASLWVFVAAFSHFISPVDLLMAYGLANILAAIPITPGGLGVVEFVLVSMITGFGPTAGQALSAVLAYRAVNFWLPIPFGGLAYASLEFERRPTYRKLQRLRPPPQRAPPPAGRSADRRRPPECRERPARRAPRAPGRRAGTTAAADGASRRPEGAGRSRHREWRPEPASAPATGPRTGLGHRRPTSRRPGPRPRVRIASRRVPEGFEGLHLEVILQVERQVGRRSGRRESPPAPVGLQLPALAWSRSAPSRMPTRRSLDLGVVDGHDHLDPPVEVPLHQVG